MSPSPPTTPDLAQRLPKPRPAQGQPLDVFVEEIPFKETRKYVKIVIGAWAAYRLLAGESPPALAKRVPEVKTGTAF